MVLANIFEREINYNLLEGLWYILPPVFVLLHQANFFNEDCIIGAGIRLEYEVGYNT